VFAGAGDAVSEREDASGSGSCAEGVEAAGAAAGVDERAGTGEDGDAEGDVDEEDPAPAPPAGEDAAEQHAADDPERGHRAVDGHGLVARLAGGERGGDQRQGVGGGERGADAFNQPPGDQQFVVRRQAVEQRREREHDDARAQHAASPVQVAGTTAEQQQAAEGQHVGGDDPRQCFGGDVEVALDARQGDVADRVVEHQHELSGGDDEKRHAEPTTIEGRFLHVGCSGGG
jgi:hypothetical protein